MDNSGNYYESPISPISTSAPLAQAAPSTPEQEFKLFKSLNTPSSLSIGQEFNLIPKTWYDSWEHSLKTSSPGPGPIPNTDLLISDASSKYFTHSSPSHSYCNLVLKAHLVEDKDFKILTSSSYCYLKSLYSSTGPDIKRYSIEMNEAMTSIEIQLKPLELVFYPDISRSSPSKFLQISHSEKVLNLTQIIKDIIKQDFDNPDLDFNSLRLWKLPKENKLEKGFNGEILMPGLILEPSLTVDESQISPNDLVVVEFCKKSGKWTLTRKETRKRTKSERLALTGLHNLGNTCFMNSALQCVASTQFLKDFYLSGRYLQDLNTSNPLGSKNAELAKTFGALMRELWKADQSSVSPWEFKKVIARQASQFNGYYQHDSHELLSYLLTGLHEDFNRVRAKTYSEMPELASTVDDEEASGLHWDWFRRRNQSVIVDNMFGQYKSKLMCPDCGKVSITFDPALSFTVAMPKVDIKRIMISIVPHDFSKAVLRIFVTVMGVWRVSKLKEILKAEYSTNFQIAVYSKANFLCMADDDVELSDIYFKDIYAYQDEEEAGVFVPVVISRSGAKGYFYNDEKQIVTSPRAVKFPLTSTGEEMHSRLRRRFRCIVDQNSSLSSLFVLNYVNTSKVTEGFFYSSQLPCDFCKKKCKNCPIDEGDSVTLQEMLDKRKNSEGVFKIEIEWNHETKSLSMLNRITDDSTHIIPEETKKTENHSLLACLQKSAEIEKLDQNNMWYCSTCKNHVQALRMYQMFKAPKYLILHLMRFKSRYHFAEKNNIFVDFPINGLDLGGVVLSQEKPRVYDLYAVSNHFGGTSGGHYTAYVKHEDCWYEMDDSHTIPINESKIVSSSAYVLFYKQRE